MSSYPYTFSITKRATGLMLDDPGEPPLDDATTAIAVLAIVLSTPVVLTRMYTRFFINRRTWWDDWTCLIGWIGLIALSSLIFEALNRNPQVRDPSQNGFGYLVKIFHIIEIVAQISMFMTKASIALLYHRLFVPSHSQRTGVWWSIWFVFLFNLTYAVALTLAVAIDGIGTVTEEGGKVQLNQYIILTCAAVTNVISDVMILFIPIAAIWSLQLMKKQKIRLCAVFAVGLLAVFVSIARLVYQVAEGNSQNQVKVVMVVYILNNVEQIIGLIVGSMPVLPSLYRHLRKERSRSSKKSSSAKVVMNSFMAKKQRHDIPGTDDGSEPLPKLHSDYLELADVEEQWTSAERQH